MGIFFGTDGIRGIVGEDLSYSLALKCGNAIAQLKSSCKVLIGRDTRTSGQMLAKSVSLGLILGGADVTDIGIATTPSISYLTRALGYDFGVVISASHNPAEYNGIKIFDISGQKISDKQETYIEKLIVHTLNIDYSKIGKYSYKPSILNKYIDFVCGVGVNLTGLNIGIDCSNGASKYIAKKIFKKLGATVHFIGMGGGKNINNKCGATYPQKIAKFVNKNKLDYGFCFDGDADRIVMVGPTGEIFTGDNILYCLANYKLLPNNNVIVGTALSNLGLEYALKQKNIKLERADVGDKYVIEKMAQLGTNIGGEQSGHIIVSNLLPTGDGVLTAVLLSGIIQKNNPSKYMSFKAYPQVMLNVATSDKLRVMGSEDLAKAINYATEELAGNGRVFVRPSGTENKIRIMVEAINQQKAQALANYIASKI